MLARSPTTLALCALLVAGCAAPQVEPVHAIEPGQRVAVLPFDVVRGAVYWRAPRSHDLGRRTTERLAERAAFEVVPYERVADLCGEDDPASLRPRDVVTRSGADFVLVGLVEWFHDDHLSCFESDPPCGCPGRSLARVKVRLFRHAKGEGPLAAFLAEEAERSPGRSFGAPVPPGAGGFVREDLVAVHYSDDGALDPTALEETLVQAIARRVALLYVTHDEARVEVE